MDISCIAVDRQGESFQCRLTTAHPSSSDNTPVLVRGDHLFAYGDAATLWLIRDLDTWAPVSHDVHVEIAAKLLVYAIEIRRYVA